MTLDEKWLHEWEAIMKRIESIDARLWQGAGILLVLSMGGISLLGWNPPISKPDFIFVVISGVFSIAVLVVWWFIFHRWIHFQRIFNHRAREIETKLKLRMNRYSRLFEYWKDKKEASYKKEFRKDNPDAYYGFEKFWESEHKRWPIHLSIERSLELLTILLIVAWGAFVFVYLAGFLRPTLLGLQ